MASHANLTTAETTLNGAETITFPWRVKRLTIINDSGNQTLQWKFKDGHDWATLQPFETIAMDCSVEQVMLLTTAEVAYRVWGLG